MFHMRMDGLMIGCALAIVRNEEWFLRAWDKLDHGIVAVCAAVFLFFLSAWLFHRYAGYYEMSLGYTLNNLAICYLLFYFIRNPLCLGGRILNGAPIAHLDVLSYSLYLWQQMFLGQYARHPLIGVVCAFVCAELSWQLVERPSFALRDRLHFH